MDYSDVHQEVVGYPFTQYDVLGNERHKAVCALRAWEPETNYSTDGMGEIHIRILYQLLNLGGAMMMDGADAAKAVRDRLIHLLGGDQPDDSSPMRQENETGITDELREYVRIHETTAMFYTTMPPQVEDKPTHNGEKLLDIAGRIDEQFARVCEQQEKVLQDTIEQMQGELEKLQSDYDEATTAVSNAVGKFLKLDHDVEMWRNRAEDMCMECDELQVKLGESQAERDELQDTITNLLNLLRDARDEYKMLDRMSADTSASFHAMRDRVWGLEAERDELQARLDELSTQNDMLRDKLDELSTSGATELYKLLKETLGDAKQVADKLNAHNGMLKESERLRRENAERAADAINKACMYLDLLRDAARDYKELRDRLWHVIRVCQSYTEAKDA